MLKFDRLRNLRRRSFFIAPVRLAYGRRHRLGVIHGYMEGMEALYEPDEKNCVCCFGNGVAFSTGNLGFDYYLCLPDACCAGKKRGTGQHYYVFALHDRIRFDVWFHRNTDRSIPDSLKERTGKK